MPRTAALEIKFRVPWKSSAHRIAAKALFRALLLQTQKSGLARKQINQIQNVIRHRFKDNRFNSSKHALPMLFKAGYQTIDHLDAAVAGDNTSRAYLSDLLLRVPDKSKKPPRPSQLLAKPKVEIHQYEKNPILNRPRPLSKLTGRRHIPRLISAGSIPVLRIKKPQPHALSGLIKHRIRQRENRLTLKENLDEQLAMAEREDEWDDILEHQHGLIASDADELDEDDWTTPVHMGKSLVQRYLDEEARKNLEMAARMQEIVDEERALARQEREERLAQRALEATQQASSTKEQSEAHVIESNVT